MIHLLVALLIHASDPISDPNYGPGTVNYDGWPPKRFTQDRKNVTVDFVSGLKIYKDCDEKPDGKYQLEACSGDKNDMALPNPCNFPTTDDYARLVCHELGHLNGWPDNHPN